eukprot:8418382-Prorocentrum_lima.AAC.1
MEYNPRWLMYENVYVPVPRQQQEAQSQHKIKRQRNQSASIPPSEPYPRKRDHIVRVAKGM